ncbi:unnamed protein product [Choristocarpus tenellus]
MRAEQGVHPGSATSLGGSSASANGDGAFLLPGGGSTMATGLPSYFPTSMYGVGVPPSYHYQVPPGYSGSSTGGAGGYYASTQDSYGRSTNPGQPIQTTSNLQGPDGCNLFVFHIPNTMTNDALFRLFSKFGNVISARIMVEKATGRSRGFGFVSYDNRDSAEKAIAQMNGYQIEHKRLKVQHKKEKERDRYHPGAPAMTPAAVNQSVTPRGANRAFHPPFRQPLLPQQHGMLRHPHQVVSSVSDSVSSSVTVQGEPSTDSRLGGGGPDETAPGKDASVSYRLEETNSYLVHGGTQAPSASVGGTARQGSGGQTASPIRQSRPRSASPSLSAAVPPMAHQTLEHALQTKLTIGGSPSPAPAVPAVAVTSSTGTASG